MDESAWVEETRHTSRVAIYMPFNIITGVLSLATPARLSDLLNNWEEDFLPIDDPRIVNLQEPQIEPVPEEGPLFVCRQEILVLHEVPTPEVRARKVSSPEQRIAKLPTAIRAYVGPFRVEGDLYLPRYSNMMAYLCRVSETFLPLTSVSISLPSRRGLEAVQVPFALVNRGCLVITSVTGSSTPGGADA